MQELGEAWTEGDLARDFPDQIKVRRAVDNDVSRLRRHVYPVIGAVCVSVLTLADVERVMSSLTGKRPTQRKLSSLTRRTIALTLNRLLSLSVYPLKIRTSSPIPKGLVPKSGKRRAMAHLYPDEDRAQMFLLLKTFVSAAQDIRNELTTPSGNLVFRCSPWHKPYMSGELQQRLDIRSGRGTRAADEVAGMLTQPRRARVPGLAPQLNRPHAAIHLGEYLQMGEIQALFERVPADPYVSAGFRHKSIMRVHVSDGQIHRATHGPLFQPKEYNPIHGDIVRHYEEIDERLGTLLEPAIHIFAGCARLGGEHEVLVQTQRITASSGDDGHTGFPVVEGWHQDNISVLGLFLVNRVNVAGGISMLAGDRRGEKLVFAQTLAVGDLLLVDDTALWHNTTPIARIDPTMPAYRDIVIMTWPSCRETVTV